VYRQRKGNVLVLDPQKELERLDASGALLIFVEHAGSTMLYKGILYLSDTSVGWDNGGIIFYRRTLVVLFCILYILADPWKKNHVSFS